MSYDEEAYKKIMEEHGDVIAAVESAKDSLRAEWRKQGVDIANLYKKSATLIGGLARLAEDNPEFNISIDDQKSKASGDTIINIHTNIPTDSKWEGASDGDSYHIMIAPDADSIYVFDEGCPAPHFLKKKLKYSTEESFQEILSYICDKAVEKGLVSKVSKEDMKKEGLILREELNKVIKGGSEDLEDVDTRFDVLPPLDMHGI